MKSISKRSIPLVLLSLVFALVASACEGTTFIDVNIDPTTGAGNIVVTGDQDNSGETDAGDTQVGNTDMSQVVLFGVVVALLLGTVAIVISASRRPSGE
jgi:hypothetical protein